jgi:sodium-independent sulfate anion transporter 11
LISLLVGDLIGIARCDVHTILSFVTGILMLILSILPIGMLLDTLFPVTVTSGFTSAAAVLIVGTQLKHFFGIPGKLPRDIIHLLPAFVKKAHLTNLPDVVVGLITLTFLLGLQYTVPHVNRCIQSSRSLNSTAKRTVGIVFKVLMATRAIIAIVVMTGVAYALAETTTSTDLTSFSNITSLNDSNQTTSASPHQRGLTLTGHVPSGAPRPVLPPLLGLWRPSIISSGSSDNSTNTADQEYLSILDVISELKFGLIVVPLISALELLALGKAMAQSNGYSVDASQEMVAAGMGNLMGSFFNTFPTSASVTRTALNSQCKVKTSLCSAVTAALVLLAAMTVANLLAFVPKAVLAAVLIAAATVSITVTDKYL